MASATIGSNSFVALKDVIRIYDDPTTGLQVPALRGVEMTVEAGEMAAVVGPSGAGKSTLLNILGGLDRPSSGIACVGDLIINAASPDALARFRSNDVGFLWQLPERNLLPNLSAIDNVILPMKLASKIPRSNRKNRARELLRAVGLNERMNHKPHQLSGGESQRAGIAIALANDPLLLLADEPTGELDSETTLKIIDYLRELNKETGITMIVVTHDYRFESISDKAYRIKDGRISGMHRLSRDGSSPTAVGSDWRGVSREELLYCDEFGNIRLPEEIREMVGIKRHVKVKLGKGHIRLYPAED